MPSITSPLPFTIDSAQFTLPGPRRFSVRTSVQHWQLRDLVQCTGNDNEIAFVHGNSCNLLNTKSKALSVALRDLSFSPTALAVSKSFGAVAGQRGQLAVRSIGGTWQAQTATGAAINNSLSFFSKSSSNATLYVGNNDETVRVYDVPSMRRITEHRIPFAVNSVKPSPDGRLLAVAGDSAQVLLLEGGASSDASLSIFGRLYGADAAFSCSWSPNGAFVAAAFQDGTVRIWDVRTASKVRSEPIATLAAIQKGQRNAEVCRCVTWSSSPGTDLLAFSEHTSVVSLVDARSFHDRQILRLSPATSETTITGVTFASDGRSLFVGLEPCIVEYQLDYRTRRCSPSIQLL